MIKIVANHNKQEVTYSYSAGQTFPQVAGKLLRLEINGHELLRLSQQKEIPISAIDTSYLVWHGRNAGRILNLLREVFE
jgi:hypothetical protein